MIADGGAEATDSHIVFLGFAGGRFEARGFPLSAASELEAYQAVLIEIGRDQWQTTKPRGGRFGGRIKDELQLRFVSTEPGSVFPVAIPESSLLLGVGPSRLDKALERLYEIIDYLARNSQIPEGLSDTVRAAVLRLGRGLRPREFFKFTSPTKSMPVKYTYEMRKKLTSDLASLSTSPRSLLGSIVEIYPEKASFKMKLLDGTLLDGKFSSPTFEAGLKGAVAGQTGRSIVRLTADCQVDGLDRVRSISDIDLVELILDTDSAWTPRLTEFLALRPGWLDGSGAAVATEVVEFARSVLEMMGDETPFAPRLYPTPSGGIQMERYTDDQHLEFVINPDLKVEAYYERETASIELEEELVTPLQVAEFARMWQS